MLSKVIENILTDFLVYLTMITSGAKTWMSTINYAARQWRTHCKPSQVHFLPTTNVTTVPYVYVFKNLMKNVLVSNALYSIIDGLILIDYKLGTFCTIRMRGNKFYRACPLEETGEVS